MKLGPRLHALYHGNSPQANRFRYALIVFDVTMIGFIVVSSFFHGAPAVEWLDIFFGIVVLAEIVARITASPARWSEFLHPIGVADAIVVLSLLAPLVGENLAFLRVARILRLMRSYQVVGRLRHDVPFFRRNQDAVFAAINLFVFVFVMTALVYEIEVDRNPGINNYADALYFTVTTLTTTGFGDITLTDTGGRLLSIAIMVFGVSLFLRLVQLMFRPPRIAWRCPSCGLNRHEPDSLHCRHCGAMLNIPHGDRD